jgi:hypothetical protein
MLPAPQCVAGRLTANKRTNIVAYVSLTPRSPSQKLGGRPNILATIPLVLMTVVLRVSSEKSAGADQECPICSYALASESRAGLRRTGPRRGMLSQTRAHLASSAHHLVAATVGAHLTIGHKWQSHRYHRHRAGGQPPSLRLRRWLSMAGPLRPHPEDRPLVLLPRHMGHIGRFDTFFGCTINRRVKPTHIWGPPETVRILHHRYLGFRWNFVEGQRGTCPVHDVNGEHQETFRIELAKAIAVAHPERRTDHHGTVLRKPAYTVHSLLMLMEHGTPPLPMSCGKTGGSMRTQMAFQLGLKPGGDCSGSGTPAVSNNRLSRPRNTPARAGAEGGPTTVFSRPHWIATSRSA